MSDTVRDLVIIGGGPAGLSAAIYASRSMLDVVTLEREASGGQMVLTGEIDNYPGLPGTDGYGLAEAMRAQGGMERFVQNGWAGKDFTHINYEGGRRIARALVDALNDFTARHASQRKAEELRIKLGKGILTPQQRRRIERRLLTKPRLETLKEPRR